MDRVYKALISSADIFREFVLGTEATANSISGCCSGVWALLLSGIGEMNSFGVTKMRLGYIFAALFSSRLGLVDVVRAQCPDYTTYAQVSAINLHQ